MLNFSDAKSMIVPADVTELFEAVVGSTFFQRLKGIAFLGAIEHFKKNEVRSAGSRFDHSLGVASLVLQLAAKKSLSSQETKVALLHALFHDIGHGPLSHSSEPFFRSVFQIDHHSTLIRMIDNPESEPARILRAYGLWESYRDFLEGGACLPNVGQLFDAPINVDTIEGILRSAKFFDVDYAFNSDEIVGSLSSRIPSLHTLDGFWSLKSCIYNSFIFKREFAQLDEEFTAALFAIKDDIAADDFYLSDEDFLQKHAVNASDPRSRALNTPRRIRSFMINDTVSPMKMDSLSARYWEQGSDSATLCENFKK